MKKILVVLWFLIFWGNCYATNYFVSNAGFDSNNGLTTGTSWKTISKVNSFPFVAGDHIFFNSGDTWHETLNLTRAGNPGNPIVYSVYGSGNAPNITGFTTVSTWTNLGANIWESTSAVSTLSTCNMVVIGGANYPMGRFPNSGFLSITSRVSYTQISNPSLNSAVTNWTGAELVLRKNDYITNRAPITSASGSALNYTSTDPPNPTPIVPDVGYGFYIQNDVRTLDQQNEWYYNPSTKKIRIYSTSMPANVQVSTLDTLLYTHQKDYVTFAGLAFTGANKVAIANSGTNNITVTACSIDFTGVDAISGNLNFGRSAANFIFQNSTINHTNNYAIQIRDEFTNALISHNTITNTGIVLGMGANGSGSYATLQCIITTATGVIIEYNRIDSVGYIGIAFYKNNVIIRNNYITHCNYQEIDGGAIYTWNGEHQPVYTGQKVQNNICNDNIGTVAGTTRTQAIAHGIYLDWGSANVEVSGNTCANNSWSGIYFHSSVSGYLHNNTLYNNASMQLLVASFDPIDLIRNLRYNQNIAFSKTAAQKVESWESALNDISQFGTTSGIDTNYVARPIDDNLTVYGAINNYTTTFQKNLAQWVTYSGFDSHSNKSPVIVSNVNQIDFRFNATSAPVVETLQPGTWKDVRNVSYSGTTTLQPYTSIILMSVGGLITPTITWNNPAAITYPAPLSATELNATSGGVPGTFVYTPASGTILNAGTNTLSVTFTPTDQTVYSTATKSVTIIVNQATATLAFSNLTQTYTGSPLAPTVTTTPGGLTVVNITYNGSGATPINAGTYTVVAGLSNPNYSATPISNTFTINKAAATINIGNLNQVYDGTPKSVTTSTSPVGLVTLSTTYNGSGTSPTNAGSYSVITTLTNPNYTATNGTGTLTIAKATPTVSWSNPGAITYPAALNGTQLNATASVAGSFTYTPASGTVLNAGSNILSVNFTPTDAANYNSVLNTTVTIVVNKGTATISLSNLAQVYDGSSKSATVTTNPVGLGAITVTYDGSVTLPINAGTYAVVASLNNPNYTATNATGNLVISKATATLSLSNTSYTYDGTAKAVTVTTAPVGLAVVSVTYNGSGTAPTNAGSYAVIATLSNTNYQGSVSGTLAIAKATPVISWSNPSAIIYGTALSGTQLNATSGGVAGSFVYTPSSGTILNAGTYTLIADFTPTDGSNYNSVNGTAVTLIVNKATATITLSNLVQDYDGNPKPVTVTTSPVGLGVISVTYNGSGTAPSAIGSYSVIATLTNTNYTATQGSGTLVIQAVAANINITNINQTYTGSPLPVTVTTSPPALAHTDTYNGSGTVPTNAGTYTVIATLNSPNVGADTATYIIAKANPVITWGNPVAITYGTALGGTQLNASPSVAGVLTYTPASGTVLNAGTQTLSVSFAPTDASNYNSIPVTTVNIVVNKAVATITQTNTTQTFDGTQKSVTVTTNPVGLSTITTTYAGSVTPPSAVGTYQTISNLSGNSNYTAVPDTVTLTISSTSAGISVSNLLQTYTGSSLPVTVTTNPTGLTYTVTYNGSGTVPTNVGSYTVIATLTGGTYTGADTQTLVIVKATPVITWPNPSNIAYGTALSGTQLNASTTVAGSFVYLPVSGTVLNVGTQSLATTFTPTDGANYNSVNKVVSITVTAASATLTLSNLLQTYNTLQHPVTVVTSPAGLSGVTITYNGSSTPPTNAGSYPIVVTLTNTNYTATPVNGTLVVAKAIPVLSWAIPAQIIYPQPLTATQLNATANIAGTFSYSPVIGTVLNPGTSILTGTFTPTDTVNYSSAVITVPQKVAGSALLDWMLLHGDQIYLNLPYP